MQDILSFAESAVSALRRFVRTHPKHVVGAVSALLLTATGATFAVATLSPQGGTWPVATVVENLLPVQLGESASARGLRLYRSDVTRSTDTADTLLKRLGIFDPEAANFLRNDALARQQLFGRSGRNITLEVIDGERLQRLVARWSPEDNGTFERLVIEKGEAGFRSQISTEPLTVSSRLAGGRITSSLFAATDEAGIPDSIAVQLAEIFSGDVDFHRGLRRDDRFSVVYELLEGDGEVLRVGRVLSAEFVNDGKTHQAMWFQDPSSAAVRGRGAYFTLDGKSLKRPFLASPMRFSRVSSGFAMRLHPIHKVWKAHLGVDYAAPKGTPVHTVGDGVVDFAGVQNGFGNVVIVKHRNNQTTVYAHLSRINVRKGQKVEQGQVVGLVGATGWATGPHLHFEFRVNGVHRDPMTLAKNNDAVFVSAAARPVFEKQAQQTRAQLAAASQVQSVAQ